MAKRIYIAGHQGMAGSALLRQLSSSEDIEILTRSRSDLDLSNQTAVNEFFDSHQIDEVYLAAAKVGGIYANQHYPADFIYQNLMIECNVIHAAHVSGVSKLLLLGSSCIYPKMAAQPMREDVLLTGDLEPSNEPYAIAKIAGIKLCESYSRQYNADFRSVMPTNLYGENDNFHPENSHVIPAMMRRFHEAKLKNLSEVVVWGSGQPKREFLHVDDMAAGAIHVMNLSKSDYAAVTEPRYSHINIGTGEDCRIQQLANIMHEVVGFEGEIVYDTAKPDGTPRKLLDISKIQSIGWKASIELKEGLEQTYRWYLDNESNLRGGSA